MLNGQCFHRKCVFARSLCRWDTAGQDKFRSITSAYYRGSHAVIIVVDVTSETSFRNVHVWLQEVSRFAPADVSVVLCANKTDLVDRRVVSSEAINQLAQDLRLPVFEVSAKSAVHVVDLFTSVAVRHANERYDSCY